MESELRQQYLEVMGIQRWVKRPSVEDVSAAARAAPDSSLTVSDVESVPRSPDRRSFDDVHTLDWPALEARVAACTQCDLHQGRTQTVFGVGNRQADWMIIGEAPGAEEDRQGEPFVGRAGQLLNEMLRAVGLARESVFIANILKCRPPRNRDPLPAEVTACEAWLQRQIELVDPRLILAVGRIAAQNLLKTEASIGKLRGKVHSFGEHGIPLVVTYHPAYLLRSPTEKRKSWQDLQMARSVIQG